MIGAGALRFPISPEGLVQASLLAQGVAEVVQRGGMAGARTKRFLEARDRFGEPLARKKQATEVVVGLGRSRGDGNGFAVAPLGDVVLARVGEQIGEIHDRIRVPGTMRDRGLEPLLRLTQATKPRKGDAPVVEKHRVAGRGLCPAREELFRRIEVAGLQSQQSEVVERARMRRRHCQDLPVQRLRVGELARPMASDGVLEEGVRRAPSRFCIHEPCLGGRPAAAHIEGKAAVNSSTIARSSRSREVATASRREDRRAARAGTSAASDVAIRT